MLHVIARLNVGGTARYIDTLVAGLQSLGVETVLATGHVQADEVEDPSTTRLPIERIPKLGRAIRPSDDLRARTQLLELVRKFDPDLIHTHTFKAGAVGRTVSKSTPHIHTFHGNSFLDPEFAGRKASAMRNLERFLVRRTDSLVAITNALAKELADAGVAPVDTFTIIPPGVRPLNTMPRAAARAALGLRESETVVAWVARFAPAKGPERVLELAHALPSVTFVMAGGGPLLNEISASAPPNVRMLGWSDPAVLFGAADLALLTSHSEGFGIALVEAQLAGIPVVAPRIGGIPEAVQDQVTGLLGTPDELPTLLRTLTQNRELRRSMGEAARARANLLFSPETLLDRHMSLYQGVLARRDIQ